MQIQDFLKTYQTKSDEELTQLAAAQGQLTSEAQLALQGELCRRRVNIAKEFESLKTDKHQHHVGTVSTVERWQPHDRQSVGDFVAEVLRMYHNYFWLFFKITAPAVIISTIVIITGRNEAREIAGRVLRRDGLLVHPTLIIEIGLVNLSSFLVSWMAFSFSFGAICIAVEEAGAGYTPSAWHSMLNVRERLGTFLRLSSLLFALMLLLEVGSILLSSGIYWALHRVPSSGLLITVVPYVTVGLALLVLSRFALAVPAVVLDDCRVGQAMFRSDELTQGKWLILAALLAKSLIGSYVAGMFPFWLVSFMPTTPLPSWFPWVLTVASIIGVSVVEPTMFIGFALLYLKMSATDSVRPRVLSSQLA